jgi:hypothetical protein
VVREDRDANYPPARAPSEEVPLLVRLVVDTNVALRAYLEDDLAGEAEMVIEAGLPVLFRGPCLAHRPTHFGCNPHVGTFEQSQVFVEVP